jgi:RNA polymerase sigma factor (sigma-70 family)
MQAHWNLEAAYEQASWLAKQWDIPQDLRSDMVQEAVIHLWQSRAKFDPSGPFKFKTWAATVMRNKMRDVGRREIRFLKFVRIDMSINGMNDSEISLLDSIAMEAIEVGSAPDLVSEIHGRTEFWSMWSPFLRKLKPVEARIVAALYQSPFATSKEIAETVGAGSDGSVRVHLTSVRRKYEVYQEQLD